MLLSELNKARKMAGLSPLSEAKFSELVSEGVNNSSDIIKVAIVDEDEWETEYDNGGGESHVDAYSFKESELQKIKLSSWDDIYHGSSRKRQTLVTALRNGTIGTKLKQVKIKNDNPDLGVEGIEAPRGFELLLPR